MTQTSLIDSFTELQTKILHSSADFNQTEADEYTSVLKKITSTIQNALNLLFKETGISSYVVLDTIFMSSDEMRQEKDSSQHIVWNSPIIYLDINQDGEFIHFDTASNSFYEKIQSDIDFSPELKESMMNIVSAAEYCQREKFSAAGDSKIIIEMQKIQYELHFFFRKSVSNSFTI